MIHSVEALQRHSGCYGKSVLIQAPCQVPRRPFALGSRARGALLRLIAAQRDAFAEAESGRPRPPQAEPFTAADLDLLAPLLNWLESL